MQPIDSVVINFNPEQLFLLNICLGFLMFGVALDLNVSNFRALLKTPRLPMIGLISQWALLPLLTLGLIFLFRPSPSIALGMLLIAACPGGNVSNFAVHLADANSALSVFMTTVSTLGAVVVTPLYFTYLSPLVPGSGPLRQEIFVAPADMVGTIVQLILIPLLIGMFLHHQYPRLTARIKRPVRMISMAIFIGFVLIAIYSNFDNIANYLHIVFYLVLVHNTAALLMGYWWARGNGLGQADARAISIETGIQNSGLGLILIFNFFNGLGGMAMIAAWWGVWHLISAFALAMLWREKSVFSVEEEVGS